MESFKYFRILFCFSLLLQILAAPFQSDEFCSGESLYKYENGKEYIYDYETDTTLWINDVSDDAKSVLTLKSTVYITPIGQCTYLLRMEESNLNGESLNQRDSSSVLSQLNNYNAVFRLNQQGELDTEVKFQPEDKQWSRNIKRAIISAFQVKSESNLRSLDHLNEPNEKSATVYETDILGRCRTTYKLEENTNRVKLNKMKSLQRCTLNENSKTSALQFVPYKTLPEFFQGRLFIEDYECNSIIENNLLESVVCKEVSTYKIGSRGRLGAQAIVNQRLSFRRQSSSSRSTPKTDSWETYNIQFEYDNTKQNELESADFDVTTFTQDICSKGKTQGLKNEHSDNFKDLVMTIKTYSTDELIRLYEQSNSRCELAGLTISQALLFADTEDSFEAVLSLMDKNAFDELRYITEYPLLTALARNQNPSEKLINKLKNYLSSKPESFPYMNKLYLIYSTLVKTYCNQNECSSSQLDNWSSLFSSNLVDDCTNNRKKELVVSSLKAIGNIGYFKNINMLANCAVNKDNSLEVRVNALQSLRRFKCEQMEQFDHTFSLLQDINQDSEIRINAFLSLIRCSDQSEKFKQFAENKLSDFLFNENDIQLLTYIIDYGKEHSLTTILNAALNDPNIKDKFSVNFKEISWNNYRYKYSIMRDSAFEVESSIIYTPKTFIPRSIKFNVTMHMFGMSVNFMEANLRLEGLDEILKASIIDKLKSEKFLKRIMQKPEQLIEILTMIADKLRYSPEKPQISFALRIYGSEVYYSRLDNADEFKKFAEFFKTPRENLYKQVMTIRNLFLINSNVKQPLINGLEFETSLDISAGLLLSKASKKQMSDDETDFDLENFYSSSLAINRRYEVQINNANKLSLKKKSFFNGRLRLDIDGQKKDGSAIYNLNLTPIESLPLMTLEGRFFKLSSNSQYREVRDFKVEQTVYDSCTSQRFETAFGVNLCLNVQRPKVSLKESLRYLLFEDVEQSMSEYDDDDDNEYVHHENDGHDDHINTLNRPSLLLSGPYKYQFILKNPKLVKTIILTAKLNKETGKFDFNADLKTKTQNGQIENTLNMNYLRESKLTNRGMNSKINFEFRKPSTNEIRLQALADFSYQKDEILACNLVIDNKIGKEFLANLNFGRNKTDINNIVPNYYLEALLDSKLVDNKRYKLMAEVKPNGKNIKSDFIIEVLDARTSYKTVKLIEADLNLKSNDQSDADLDYDLDFIAKTSRKGLLKMNGKIVASLLKSNIDVTIDYSNPNFRLPKPAMIKIGHMYDGAPNAKSYIELDLDLPFTSLNYGSKLLFSYNLETKKFDSVEIQIRKPERTVPFSIFYEKQTKTSITTEYRFGLKNSQLNLNNYESLKSLTNFDGQNILRSFVISFVRTHDKVAKRINTEINMEKNERVFVTFKYDLKGDLKAIRESTTEIPRQSVGGNVYVKVFEHLSSLNAELDFESSKRNNKHDFDFEIKSEGLVKVLTKIESIKSKLSMDKGRLDAKVEILKTDDIRSYKLESNGNVRVQGDSKEFNINYEKVLRNGQKIMATGIARYTFNDFKNFETSITVDNHYMSEMSLETKRTNTDDLFAYHLFKFTNKHLDGSATLEREIRILIDNRTISEGNQFLVEASLKRGGLNSLLNKNKLDLIFDLKTDNTMTRNVDGSRKLTNTINSLEFKSKQFNIDLNTKTRMTRPSTIVEIETETLAKFPSFISAPGKTRQLNQKLTYTRNTLNNEMTLNNQYETDSQFLSRPFSKLNVDLSRKVLNAKNIKGNLNVAYKLQDNYEEKTYKMTWEHDYVKLKATLQQNRLPVITSLFKDGEQIEINDCLFNGKYDRQKTTAKYLLDVLFDLNCNNKRLLTDKLLIKVANKDTEVPATLFKFSTISDIYYEEKSIEMEHQKFNSQNGLIKLVVKQLQNEIPETWSNEFSYKRTVDKITKKLEKANYKLALLNPKMDHSCDVNIETKIDYINEVICKVDGSNIGYYMKLERPFESLSGRRGIQFDLTSPQRKMRLVYKSHYATPIDGTDDDNDDNDEREFNGTASFQWDLLRNPSKLITFNLKRDNFAKGKSLFFIETLDHPRFDLIKFQIIRTRSFNETSIQPALMYQLRDGNSNRLDLNILMSSDMDTNSFSLETNLQRPKFNTKYENKYNKNNGRLQYLGVRLGNLIKLNIDKESDPEQRRISLEFVNPDSSKYTYEATSKNVDNKYIVEGILSKNSRQLSKIVSSFDSDNNNFDVKITGIVTGKSYRMNFGIFNETLANAYISNESENKVLCLASLSVDKHEDHHDLVLTSKWNRLWIDIQSDILGGQDMESRAQENEKYNSYFGDVYAVLSSDLKPALDAFKKERLAIIQDYSLEKIMWTNNNNNQEEDLPLYKRFFRSYNTFAMQLTQMNLYTRKYSKSLSTYIPRLPTVEYNKDQLTREMRPFDNNLVIKRPTLNARNLYQFNAEYRNYIKQIGENILSLKNNLVRNLDGMGVKALINKYKYRSLKDYTLVGNVFNRRNIIGFDGEQTLLQSRCRYLLAHETHKNRFSVILNFNDNPYPISVYAYGQKSVDISYNKAAIDNKQISLPQTMKLGENGVMTITRNNLAICVELNNDLKVCCYEDSSSCTIATTRWFTGKVNGLLGNVNKNVEKIQENEWYLDKSCRLQNVNMRKPSDDAVKQCNSLFGRNSRSLMKDAMMAIKPTGWQRMCETVLSADSKAKCTLLKSFDHFADQQNVNIEPPSECYTCNLKSNKLNAGESISKDEASLTTNFEKGSDYVFLTLPCDKRQYSIDFTNFVKSLRNKNPTNRYYVVSIDEHDASIYQSSTNEISNFELNKAYETLSDAQTVNIHKQQFNKGLFLAASLFSKRLAQQRHLVIRSCGNCLPYSAIDAIKYSKMITERNVVVHSWGSYEMKNLENDDSEEEIPIGYNEEELYLYKSNEKTIETDSLDSYKIEHNADLCQRLAVKTKGTVMNIKYLHEKDIMNRFGDLLQEQSDKHDYEFKIKKCQKLDTPFGDMTDFLYTRKTIVKDD